MPRDHWREFPRELTSVDEIPSPIGAAIHSFLPATAPPIHLFLIPQPRTFWDWFRDSPPRNSLFALTEDHRVVIAQENAGGIEVNACAADQISNMEVGTVLLNSWLVMTYPSTDGPVDVRLEYGTVFERTFRTAVLWLRALNDPDPRVPPRHVWRMPGEEAIKQLPIKFNNAARNYWLDGETALDACFIPALCLQTGRFARLMRPRSNATSLILSDHQLLVIEEQASTGPGRWGQAWRFCPLHRIRAVVIDEAGILPVIRLTTAEIIPSANLGDRKPRGQICIPFPPDRREEMGRFVSRLRSVSAAASGHVPA